MVLRPACTITGRAHWRAAGQLLALLFALAALAPPAAQAQAADPTKELVAVLPLQPVGISDVYASALTDRLGEELLKSGRYTLVDRSQIDAILNEQALQQSGCTEQECAVQVGRILGVRSMVAGKITRIEADLWLLSAILVDVETAQTLRAESVRHRGDYVDLLDRGVGTLVGKLTGDVTTAAPAVPPAETPPATTQAPQPAAGGSGGSVWLYVGAGVLGLYAAAEYNTAVDLNDKAQSTAQSDPAKSQSYEDDRDAAAQAALAAGVVAAGLLAWAIAAGGSDGAAAGAEPGVAPMVALRARDAAAGVELRLRW